MKYEPIEFELEALEERRMLSTVQIFAFGAEGGEQFDLQIDNESVASYTTTQQPQAFTYNTNEDVSADQIRVVFTNDQYDPANNVDVAIPKCQRASRSIQRAPVS